jgi:hypothetical protein
VHSVLGRVGAGHRPSMSTVEKGTGSHAHKRLMYMLKVAKAKFPALSQFGM